MSRLSAALTKIATLVMAHKEIIGSDTMTTTAQTLTGAVNELDGDISSLNGNLGGFKFHYLSRNVSIPENSYLEIDISSISNSPFIMASFLGQYMLPYSEGGVVKTWVYTVTGGKIRIQNNTTAWTNFAFSAVIASR